MAYGSWRGMAAALLLAGAVIAVACSANDDPAQVTVASPTVGVGGGGGQGGGTGGVYVDPNCEEQPCKLVAPQCGCRETDRCNLVGDPLGPACVVDGDKSSSQLCANDCEEGFICVDNGTNGGSICHEYCATDADCSAPGGLCTLDVGGGQAKVCTHNCDPISQAGCAEAANKCDIFSEPAGQMRNLTQCAGAGAGAQGDVCTVTSDCGAGLSCLPVGMMSQCLTWCDVNSPVCPGVTSCVAFNPPIQLGATQYGACT